MELHFIWLPSTDIWLSANLSLTKSKIKIFVKLFWKYLRIYSLNNLIMSKNSLHPATKCGNLNITKYVIHKMKNNYPTTLETSWDLITNLAEVEILIFDWFQRIESIPKTNVEWIMSGSSLLALYWIKSKSRQKETINWIAYSIPNISVLKPNWVHILFTEWSKSRNNLNLLYCIEYSVWNT